MATFQLFFFSLVKLRTYQHPCTKKLHLKHTKLHVGNMKCLLLILSNFGMNGNTFHEIHSVVLKLQHTANLHIVTQFIVNAPIKMRDRSSVDGRSKFL